MKNKVIIMLFIILLLSLCLNLKSISPLNLWTGKYTFFEWSPGGAANDVNWVWEYGIDIYEKEGQYYADITIHGAFMGASWKAIVYGKSESIDFVFDSYASDHIVGGNFEKGDILFTFKKEGDEILTYWGKYEPQNDENQESGKVYFIKGNIIYETSDKLASELINIVEKMNNGLESELIQTIYADDIRDINEMTYAKYIEIRYYELI